MQMIRVLLKTNQNPRRKESHRVKNEFLDVYTAAIPTARFQINGLQHAGRRQELLQISNEEALRERFFVWQLLEKAVYLRTGRTAEDLEIKREKSGAWTSPQIFVSLSHTKGFAAAAISSSAVGVDIEREAVPRAAKFADKTLTVRELEVYLSLGFAEREAYLVSCWSMKEALFKARGGGAFVPREIDTSKGVLSQRLTFGEQSVFLSVASDKPDLLKINHVALD